MRRAAQEGLRAEADIDPDICEDIRQARLSAEKAQSLARVAAIAAALVLCAVVAVVVLW